MMVCTKCNVEKPPSGFYQRKDQKRERRRECSECFRKRHKVYRENNSDKVAARQKRWAQDNREHLHERGRIRRLEKRGICLIAAARIRARKKKVAFDLDGFAPELQRRLELGVCELTGTPLDLSPGRTFASPSLDRIKPSEGYVPSNVRLVCFAANAALGEWGEEVLAEIMTRWLAKRNAINCQAAAEVIRAYLDVT